MPPPSPLREEPLSSSVAAADGATDLPPLPPPMEEIKMADLYPSLIDFDNELQPTEESALIGEETEQRGSLGCRERGWY